MKAQDHERVDEQRQELTMICIGTMDWKSTRLRGQFACPNCGTNENFRLRASRPFLTLYFIPVVPIGGLNEFVECSRCKNSYEPIVLANRMVSPSNSGSLSGNPASTVTFEEDLLRMEALMMIEDGHVTEDEIRVARLLFQNITQQNLARDDLGRMWSQVSLQRLSTSSFLATAALRRSHDEKLLMVQAMFGIAGADGDITPKRLQSLLASQKSLGLDELEFKTAIESTQQWLS